MSASLAQSKRRQTHLGRGAACVGLCLWAGCQAALTAPPEAALEKLLHPVVTSPDSVTLEIFEARIPLDEDAQADAIWRQIDEQPLDADLRQRLLANGLRAGVIGGTVPDELSNLLGLVSEAPQESAEQVVTADLPAPRTKRRVVQINRHAERAIQATEVLAEASILLSEDGQLRGETYRQVEGRYALRAEASPGQRITVRLVPELHHGELRPRYSAGDQGMMLIMTAREREPFEQLTIEADLSPGEMLVLGCLPQSDGSLGAVLHTATTKGRRERKLILVRALEAPASEILADR